MGPRPPVANAMQHRIRAIWILVVLACGFTAISFNLIQIQLVQHEKFWRMAIANHTHPEAIPARRGAILDGDGYILAQTQRVYDIRLDGLQMKAEHPELNLPRIEGALQLPPGSLTFNPHNRYQLIAHDVEDGVATKLAALKLDCLIVRSARPARLPEQRACGARARLRR